MSTLTFIILGIALVSLLQDHRSTARHDRAVEAWILALRIAARSKRRSQQRAAPAPAVLPAPRRRPAR